MHPDKPRGEDLNQQQVIGEIFLETWQIMSTVDITDYFFLIRERFDLDFVRQTLMAQLGDAFDPERDIRVYTPYVRQVTTNFVVALLETSDNGKTITHHTIDKATEMVARVRRRL